MTEGKPTGTVRGGDWGFNDEVLEILQEILDVMEVGFTYASPLVDRVRGLQRKLHDLEIKESTR